MAPKQSQKMKLVYAESFPLSLENVLSKHVCQHFQRAEDYSAVANTIIRNLVCGVIWLMALTNNIWGL